MWHSEYHYVTYWILGEMFNTAMQYCMYNVLILPYLKTVGHNKIPHLPFKSLLIQAPQEPASFEFSRYIQDHK